MTTVKCPFCGSEDCKAYTDLDEGHDPINSYMECNHCGAKSPDSIDEEAAIAVWNKPLCRGKNCKVVSETLKEYYEEIKRRVQHMGLWKEEYERHPYDEVVSHLAVNLSMLLSELRCCPAPDWHCEECGNYLDKDLLAKL